MGRTGRMGALTAVAAAAAFTLAACGGASSSSAASGNSSVPTANSSAAVAKGVPVSVVEKEFSITVAPAELHAGTYSFTVRNAGTFPHNLTVQGPGVAKQASPTLSPGQSAVLTLTLQQGSYELWCSVDGHKDRGMDRTLNVS